MKKGNWWYIKNLKFVIKLVNIIKKFFLFDYGDYGFNGVS